MNIWPSGAVRCTAARSGIAKFPTIEEQDRRIVKRLDIYERKTYDFIESYLPQDGGHREQEDNLGVELTSLKG